jgi:hypothetical protein
VARGRTLGDVLHYFISEDEQAEIRAHKSAARTGSLLLPASPERPLSCALAFELASALAPAGGAEILASFAPSPLVPRVAEVSWTEVADLAAALGAARPALVVERPARLAGLLERAPVRALDALLLPMTAAPLGLSRALGFLRSLAPLLTGRRVLVLALGAPNDAAGAELAARLASAAERQLGLRVERAGELRFDAAGYRSLLHGESLQALRDAGARVAARVAA